MDRIISCFSAKSVTRVAFLVLVVVMLESSQWPPNSIDTSGQDFLSYCRKGIVNLTNILSYIISALDA